MLPGAGTIRFHNPKADGAASGHAICPPPKQLTLLHSDTRSHANPQRRGILVSAAQGRPPSAQSVGPCPIGDTTHTSNGAGWLPISNCVPRTLKGGRSGVVRRLERLF